MDHVVLVCHLSMNTQVASSFTRDGQEIRRNGGYQRGDSAHSWMVRLTISTHAKFQPAYISVLSYIAEETPHM